jgi:hypothetical protein
VVFVRTLPAIDIPKQGFDWLTPALALLLCLFGLLLAVYLARS